MKWLKRFLYYLGRGIRVVEKVDQIYEDEMKLKKKKEEEKEEKEDE